MASFTKRLGDYLRGESPEESLSALTSIFDHQAAGQPIGASRINVSTDWAEQRTELESLVRERDEGALTKALQTLSKIVEALDLYAPTLKGLGEVHAYTCECLEGLIFDQRVSSLHGTAAAYLYGQVMALSAATSEAVALAVENLLLRGDSPSANLSLCIFLGVERSNTILFESNIHILLRQIQVVTFSTSDRAIAREALLSAIRIYSPSEKAISCQVILQTTHTLLMASLKLCEQEHTRDDGVVWTCFIVENVPTLLRMDLQDTYPETCQATGIFSTLSSIFPQSSREASIALCGALPILTTWTTSEFVDGGQVEESVRYMLKLPVSLRAHAMTGLGQVANVVLDRFEPYLEAVGNVALEELEKGKQPSNQQAAQILLRKLLAAMGPMTLSTIIRYLRCPSRILLADVGLLEMIAILLPNLASRVIQLLGGIVDDLLADKPCEHGHAQVLYALGVFPLTDTGLAQRAQKLALWGLSEERGKEIILASLQLSVNPFIATKQIMRSLTFKAAQLLLADDPHIVHVALSVLSNPSLAGSLDERSCSMILMALHQSLEPSIQIVAAKLLTHLTTAHRAIVQPLAWSHVRQSLSLMDFLHSVDPNRAITEACIISNLLPALPPSLHKKYVGPVKSLILTGLTRPNEGHTLSLIFQGLANLAKFEAWGSAQQSELAMDLLEMTQEIPKDSQHAALNAISRLLSVPQEGLDVYELLITVHATFGGRGIKLDADLKALVSGIYGHLGTVERNPVISRDSKAAINRESSIYTTKTILSSQIAEIRDKSGASSQQHINWLVTKNLVSALTPSISNKIKIDDERSLGLEVMTTLGILQPRVVPGLVPDLPGMILRELRLALGSLKGEITSGGAGDGTGAGIESTPVAAGLLFLGSALHTSNGWLQQYWTESAEMMAECITAGQGLSVLRSLDVILDTIPD